MSNFQIYGKSDFVIGQIPAAASTTKVKLENKAMKTNLSLKIAVLLAVAVSMNTSLSAASGEEDGSRTGSFRAAEKNVFTSLSHQYQWSSWLTLNDGKSNGVQFAFRKGDNNFIERGMIFVRIYNRYRSTISGDVTFVIVNTSTGAESGTRAEPFYMKPESLKESGGSWFTVPGNNESPDGWARTSINLRDIRVKNLRISTD